MLIWGQLWLRDSDNPSAPTLSCVEWKNTLETWIPAKETDTEPASTTVEIKVFDAALFKISVFYFKSSRDYYHSCHVKKR